MTKTTTNLLGIIITILAGTYFFVTYCSECGTSNEAVPGEEDIVAPVVPEATSYPFSFSGGDYAYNVNDNFNFNVSSSSILSPVSQKVEDGITSLKAFLAGNAGKVINITGYYKSDEANTTAFPNLGLARANAVKNYLVSKEISSARINTMGKLMENMYPEDNIFMGPLAYSLEGESENVEDQLKALYDKITADPLVLNFDTAETSIKLTAKQQQKFADISRYLDKAENATCKVVGHTDNNGQRSTNIKLGQDRADFAKAYLMSNGIAESKIKASSQGSNSPIASNGTDEGRAQNRRAVITLN